MSSLENFSSHIDIVALVRSNKFDFDACSQKVDYCLNSDQIRYAFAEMSIKQRNEQYNKALSSHLMKSINENVHLLQNDSKTVPMGKDVTFDDYKLSDTKWHDETTDSDNNNEIKATILITEKDAEAIDKVLDDIKIDDDKSNKFCDTKWHDKTTDSDNNNEIKATILITEKDAEAIDKVLDDIEIDDDKSNILDTFVWAQNLIQKRDKNECNCDSNVGDVTDNLTYSTASHRA